MNRLRGILSRRKQKSLCIAPVRFFAVRIKENAVVIRDRPDDDVLIKERAVMPLLLNGALRVVFFEFGVLIGDVAVGDAEEGVGALHHVLVCLAIDRGRIGVVFDRAD